jgi:hypothetical protein
MLSFQELFATQRQGLQSAGSTISRSNSLYTGMTSTSITSNSKSPMFKTYVDNCDFVRNVHIVHQRLQHEITYSTTLNDSSTSQTVTTNNACSIFVADHFNQHTWPSTSMKDNMIRESFQQANAITRRERCSTIELTTLQKLKVCLTLLKTSPNYSIFSVEACGLATTNRHQGRSHQINLPLGCSTICRGTKGNVAQCD